MKNRFGLCLVAVGFGGLIACDSSDSKSRSDATKRVDAATRVDAGYVEDAGDPDDDAGASEPASTVLDLADVKSNPSAYEWFDFRPDVKKLILAGAAETEHIAILWYTTMDGGVGLHYHGKTESVYVIDGTQTDAKGVYPTGSVYFNPPGSGHQITDSTGFFLLAYAAPPDFMKTDLIGEYTPIRIDTAAPELTDEHPFEKTRAGVRVFTVPLDADGGLAAAFVETSSTKPHAFGGNYVLVLRGQCAIEGVVRDSGTLVVAKTVEPRAYEIAAPKDGMCLALGLSF